jgi:molybdenum cofactor cytidylyltransferase
MGNFKPLLSFGSKTVIETCVEHLHEAGAEKIIVVVGHRADEIKTRLHDADVSFVPNPDPQSEMAVSIACGVAQLPQEARAVVIALTDYPAVSSEVTSTLIDHWKAGAKLIIPEFRGHGGHPVIVDLSYREELMKLDPQGGLRSLFDTHKTEVLRVPVSSPYVARDMDTWDDYRALHLELFGVPPPAPGPDSSETAGGKH